MVLLTQRDDQLARRALLRLEPWTTRRREEELGVGIAPKVVAKDAEGADAIAERTGHLCGGLLPDEEGSQRLILAVARIAGPEKEAADVS